VRQLQNLGYEADVVANGKEVLQILEKIPYDLILMDCQMPIKDGFETTREIRCRQASLGEEGRPIVIAMTANAMKEDRQKCLDAGMDDYLSKPVFKDQLAAAIERWSPVISTAEVESLEVIDMSDLDQNSREIDWNHLHKMSDNNTEFELELLQIFVEDSLVHIEAIKDAIATNDFNQLQRKCHHLKGSSGNVGATAMKLAAETLEQMAHRQHLDGANELIIELEGALSRIEALLEIANG
jgi:CheY-like chemotaxis protein/HPt (histidine-containing phosphotransfer) domain-containing protein